MATVVCPISPCVWQQKEQPYDSRPQEDTAAAHPERSEEGVGKQEPECEQYPKHIRGIHLAELPTRTYSKDKKGKCNKDQSVQIVEHMLSLPCEKLCQPDAYDPTTPRHVVGVLRTDDIAKRSNTLSGAHPVEQIAFIGSIPDKSIGNIV